MERASLDPLGDPARDLQLVLRHLLRGDPLTSASAAPAGSALATLGTRWRSLVSPPASGAENMAVDAALLAHARRTGEATLRTYAWSQRTLSLGRHERARGLYAAARLAAHGVDVVRRPTGGRALLHHRELTYSVTAPSDGASLAESYQAINALLRAALSRLGVEVSEAPRAARSLRPDGSACFAEPSAGELIWQGAKLAGSAQLREDGALLQHGSILLEDDQALIRALRTTGTPPPGNDPRVATLHDALGAAVEPVQVSDALHAALADLLGAPDPIPVLDPAFLRPDLARLESAFRDPAWTWRR